MEIILATRNPSKAEQIKNIFSGSSFIIKTLIEAKIEGDAVEDGITLNENALKKARYAFNASGYKSWTMADDTGLFIDTLNGEPGIKAARWAGENATTEEIMNHCLKRLEGKNDRSATFETVVAVVTPMGDEYFFSGKVHGQLLEFPRVKFQPGMSYSGLFVPEGDNLTWAEMTVENENKISHRGKAFRKVRLFLEKQSNNTYR